MGDGNALVVIIDAWGCVDRVHLPSSRLMVRRLMPETTDSITTRATSFLRWLSNWRPRPIYSISHGQLDVERSEKR